MRLILKMSLFQMENLPEELCCEIFSYLTDVISAREVCFNWKQLIENRTTKITRQLSKQSSEAIKNLINVLDQFTNIKRIQLIVMYDHHLSVKESFDHQLTIYVSSSIYFVLG